MQNIYTTKCYKLICSQAKQNMLTCSYIYINCINYFCYFCYLTFKISNFEEKSIQSQSGRCAPPPTMPFRHHDYGGKTIFRLNYNINDLVQTNKNWLIILSGNKIKMTKLHYHDHLSNDHTNIYFVIVFFSNQLCALPILYQ